MMSCSIQQDRRGKMTLKLRLTQDYWWENRIVRFCPFLWVMYTVTHALKPLPF